VPGAETYLEFYAADARRSQPYEFVLTRPAYETFLRRFAYSHPHQAPSPKDYVDYARTLQIGIAIRLKDFLYYVRKGDGLREHEGLAQALKEHFESSFLGAKVELRRHGNTFDVLVAGLSDPDETRVFTDSLWKAKRDPVTGMLSI